MYSLLSDSKRKYFPNVFVKLLGYTIYNAKKRSDAPNELNVALAHYNYAKKIPKTIKDFIPRDCLLNDGENYFESSIGKNSVIHGHGTLPTMAQKYKVPMWEVPDLQDLGDEKGTIKGNSRLYYNTRASYNILAEDVLARLELI